MPRGVCITQNIMQTVDMWQKLEAAAIPMTQNAIDRYYVAATFILKAVMEWMTVLQAVCMYMTRPAMDRKLIVVMPIMRHALTWRQHHSSHVSTYAVYAVVRHYPGRAEIDGGIGGMEGIAFE